MEEYKKLKEKIKKKEAIICIIGLGYVGLPLTLLFLEKGFKVFGIDNNHSRIRKLKKGIPYITDINYNRLLYFIKRSQFVPSTDETLIRKSDIIIICVPTPLRKVKLPDIRYVIKAAQSIKKFLHKGQLIILESTSYPTTTRDIVLPILQESGLKEGIDFYLCFSPERVNPGDKEFLLEKIPKIIGGISKEASLLAKELYSYIIKTTFIVSSPEVAESSKLLENTFRLINIALVNEFAILCHKLNINIWEVIKAAATKPFGYMSFYPGPGVGGHCIPTDPIYLSWKAKKVGFKTKMIDLASYINHYMPKYVVKRVEKTLKKICKRKHKKIFVVGVTYKKDVKDLRESPALDIIEILKKKGYQVIYFDPFIPYLKINNLNMKSVSLENINWGKIDAVIIVTDHSNIDYELIRQKAKYIFDTRNVYNKDYDNIERL